MGLLTRLFRAATPENPRWSLNDPNAVEAFLGGTQEASSGIHVSADTALTYSPWWRGINLIARDVAKLPLFVYRREGEGKARATDHQAYYLLRRKPNEYQTAFTFRQQLTAHALSRGNGYAYIVRNGAGVPLEILPLDPAATYPVRENGQLWYVTQFSYEQSVEKRKLAATEVLHVKGLGYDGLCGYSVVEKAKESLGVGMGARKYSAVFFRNNARTPVVLEAPMALDKRAKDELVAGWERMHGGLDNAHRTAVLDRGLKVAQISFNAEDSQLIETRQFEIREVANWLGVPPHKLGDTTRTAYASLEQENQSYLDDALDGWLCAWEEECWDKLLAEEEKEADTHLVEFLRQALVRADINARGNYYRTALGGAPWMTRNEVRGLENLNPVEGGNTIIDPLNMGQGGRDNGDPRPRGPGVALVSAVRRSLEDAAGRMVRRIGLHARRAAKKPKEFLAWLDGLEAEHHGTIADALAPALAAADAMTGMSHDVPAEADRFLLRDHLLRLAGECTAANLEATIDRFITDMEATLPVAWALEMLPEKTDENQ